MFNESHYSCAAILQKEKKNYHLQIQSDRMEEMDVKVTIEELKKQIQAVAKEVEKLWKEE